MSKFTPGPWRIDLDAQIDCKYGRTSGAIVAADGSPVVVFDPSEDEYIAALDPESANARLMAAAPEMYAFIEEWLQAHTMPGVTDSPREAQARALLTRID